MFNVAKMPSNGKGSHPLYRTEAVLDGFQLSKSHRSGYMAVLFIFIGRMLFLGPTFDNDDELFTLLITRGFYLHHVEVVQSQLVVVGLYNAVYI